MPAVFIPEVGQVYRLTDEWKPMMSWDDRNLVLLRNLKLTGTKKVSLGTYYQYDTSTGRMLVDENGKPLREEKTINRTVPNPLFKDDDGKMVPVMVTFPKDTELELTQLKTSYNNRIYSVWMKVRDCPDKRFLKRVLSVSVAEFNGAEMEHVGAI